MRFLAMALALLAPLSTTQAQGPTDQGVVPFELSGGRIYIEAFVNDRGSYRFALDTGASGAGRADMRLTEGLALPKVAQAQNSDGVVVTATDVVTVDVIRVGPVTKRKVELLSRDYNRNLKPGAQPMMGIIGRDFFADVLITIDYPARIIRFGTGALDPKSPGVVQFGPGFAIPVCFGTLCRPGKVDTGSNRGLVLPKSFALSVSTGTPVLLGQAARMNSSVSLYKIAPREEVSVGGITATVSR